MALDELDAFAGALGGRFNRALPFEHGPATIACFRQEREDALEVDLAVAGRPETSGALRPRLVATVDPTASIGSELRVFHVKTFDQRSVEPDELEVVELLQEKVTRIVVHC